MPYNYWGLWHVGQPVRPQVSPQWYYESKEYGTPVPFKGEEMPKPFPKTLSLPLTEADWTLVLKGLDEIEFVDGGVHDTDVEQLKIWIEETLKREGFNVRTT